MFLRLFSLWVDIMRYNKAQKHFVARFAVFGLTFRIRQFSTSCLQPLTIALSSKSEPLSNAHGRLPIMLPLIPDSTRIEFKKNRSRQ